jgi:hypothetical protein
MPLDKQVAGVLQQFRDIPEPDFSQVDAAQYRQFSDNLLPAIPGDPMTEVRELRVAGAEGELDARLYRPVDEDNLPLLVFFHGGGLSWAILIRTIISAVPWPVRQRRWWCRSLTAWRRKVIFQQLLSIVMRRPAGWSKTPPHWASMAGDWRWLGTVPVATWRWR